MKNTASYSSLKTGSRQFDLEAIPDNLVAA